MIRLEMDTSKVVSALRRLPDRTLKVTAQELNTQRKQSRTLITNHLSAALSITPKKRIRRRIALPRGGNATPQRLEAVGLTLTHWLPGRYFAKGKRGRGGGFTMILAGGSKLLNTRSTAGGFFKAEMKNGYEGVFRRVVPKKQRAQGSNRSHLPIQEVVVDVEVPSSRARHHAMRKLASEWPDRWESRMARELKKVMG